MAEADGLLVMAAASIAPITALHHSNGLLLVGSANILRVYTAATGALISTTTVLPAGESVHGIRIIAHNFLLVFGVREVRCHRLDEQQALGRAAAMGPIRPRRRAASAYPASARARATPLRASTLRGRPAVRWSSSTLAPRRT